MQTKTFTAESGDSSKRIDIWLTSKLEDMTRSSIVRLIDDGLVTVNNVCVSKSYKLFGDEIVNVMLPPPKELAAVAQKIELDIVYEDSDLLVVNKPKGMVVHPAPGNPDGTLVNALLYHCKGDLSGINGVMRPGIVHRIDKDTSGLLIVAKNDLAHIGLSKQLKAHSFTRAYEAIVYGNVKEQSGTICAPIGRHKVDRKKMCVTEINSKSATTHFEVICNYNGYTHLRLRLETGRTHQIRVHLAHIGYPVAGDTVYAKGRANVGTNGQCLHARLIGFNHPRTGKYMEIESPLPDYFIKLIERIED